MPVYLLCCLWSTVISFTKSSAVLTWHILIRVCLLIEVPSSLCLMYVGHQFLCKAENSNECLRDVILIMHYPFSWLCALCISGLIYQHKCCKLCVCFHILVWRWLQHAMYIDSVCYCKLFYQGINTQLTNVVSTRRSNAIVDTCSANLLKTIVLI